MQFLYLILVLFLIKIVPNKYCSFQKKKKKSTLDVFNWKIAVNNLHFSKTMLTTEAHIQGCSEIQTFWKLSRVEKPVFFTEKGLHHAFSYSYSWTFHSSYSIELTTVSATK